MIIREEGLISFMCECNTLHTCVVFMEGDNDVYTCHTFF